VSKSAFLSELVLKAVPPSNWELVEPLSYRTYVKSPKGSVIKVPVGEHTDLASLPRAVRIFISQNGRHRAAAVVHDRLYRSAGKVSYTRKQADLVFLEAMCVSGVPWWKRQMMYRGVRAGGWVVYNKYLKVNK
tara:strand:- start:128 stop:526 length:399 start_codon:yes stop_codon:yes gene_type:complete